MCFESVCVRARARMFQEGVPAGSGGVCGVFLGPLRKNKLELPSLAPVISTLLSLPRALGAGRNLPGWWREPGGQGVGRERTTERRRPTLRARGAQTGGPLSVPSVSFPLFGSLENGKRAHASCSGPRRMGGHEEKKTVARRTSPSGELVAFLRTETSASSRFPQMIPTLPPPVPAPAVCSGGRGEKEGEGAEGARAGGGRRRSKSPSRPKRAREEAVTDGRRHGGKRAGRVAVRQWAVGSTGSASEISATVKLLHGRDGTVVARGPAGVCCVHRPVIMFMVMYCT